MSYFATFPSPINMQFNNTNFLAINKAQKSKQQKEAKMVQQRKTALSWLKDLTNPYIFPFLLAVTEVSQNQSVWPSGRLLAFILRGKSEIISSQLGHLMIHLFYFLKERSV